MAGLGRKIFTRERATVSDVQGYLMDQVVMRFASASARATAVPSPSLGMTSFLDATGMIEVWNGSAWRQHSAIRPQWTSRTARTGSTDSYSPGSFANLITGTWVGAPAGIYTVIAQMSVQSSAAVAGTARLTLGTTILAEPRADVTAAAVAVYTFPEQYAHAGGDLAYKLDHNAGGSNAITVVNPGTKMIITFQGATP